MKTKLRTLALSLLFSLQAVAQPSSSSGPYQLTLAKINAAISAGTVQVNSLEVSNRIKFTGAGASSSVFTTVYADANAGNLFANVPTGKYHQHRVAGNGLLSLGKHSNIQANTAWAIGGFRSRGSDAAALSGISSNGEDLAANIITGSNFSIYWNVAEKYRLSSTLLEAPSISLGGTIGSSIDPGAGGLALTGKFYISTSQTPASATATGTVGQVVWDASYIYICTATNTWKRAAIATW